MKTLHVNEMEIMQGGRACIDFIPNESDMVLRPECVTAWCNVVFDLSGDNASGIFITSFCFVR